MPGLSALATMRGKRQSTITFSLNDYGTLQRSAAALKTSVSELVTELLQPGLKRLRKNPPTRDDDED